MSDQVYEARFIPIHELSRSNYGQTTLLRDNLTQRTVVSKCFIKSSFLNAEAVELFFEKCQAVAELNLSFVVPCQFYVDQPDRILFIREFVDHMPISRIGHEANTIQIVWRHLLSDFAQLHEHHIYPNIIKLSNIWVTDDKKVMLTDVCMMPTNAIGALETPNTNDMMLYAPEHFTNEFPLSQKSDVWSLGAILLTLFGTPLPWMTKNICAMVRMITAPRIDIPDYLPRDVTDILNKTFQHDPSHRPNVCTLLKLQRLSVPETDWNNILINTQQRAGALERKPSTSRCTSVLSNIGLKLRKKSFTAKGSNGLPPIPPDLLQEYHLARSGQNIEGGQTQRPNYNSDGYLRNLKAHAPMVSFFDGS